MNTSEQWNAALKNVLVKASSDASFREQCLADPAAAILQVSGLVAPAGLRFAEAPDGNAIVLPRAGADLDELTDSELLTNVAGGSGPTAMFSLDDKPKPGQSCEW